MLEIGKIRENKEGIVLNLEKRGKGFDNLIEKVLEIDENRRSTQATLDNKQSEMNQLSKKIGVLFKSGKKEEAESIRNQTGEIKAAIQGMKDNLCLLEAQQKDLLYQIPNCPHDLVPAGNSEKDNEIVSEHGKAEPNPHALPHWELAEKYNLIDFELGVKVTGAGFPVYRGKGAKLQRALINFFLTEAEKAGYEEFIPPHVINEASGYGTGQLPDKEGQMYHIVEDDLYLIPTAEVPLTNLYRDVLLQEKDFPIKLCGYTPCFRREAGSYGKDVRGLNRLHQFDKVEIVQVEHPDKSYETLDNMVDYVKGLLDKLGLPYRVARLCSGDLGFTAALTYDMEVFSSAQDKWLEVSSISNFESYQANRLKLRFRGMDNKNRMAHTLNGSALALPRIMAALLENNQTKNGIDIPEVLVPFTGFEKITN